MVVLSSSIGGPVAVAALMALAVQHGLVSALLPVATARVSSHERFAAAYGRVFSSFGVAAVNGPMLGALLHTGGGYTGAFRASLVAPVLVAAALVTYRRRLADTV